MLANVQSVKLTNCRASAVRSGVSLGGASGTVNRDIEFSGGEFDGTGVAGIAFHGNVEEVRILGVQSSGKRGLSLAGDRVHVEGCTLKGEEAAIFINGEATGTSFSFEKNRLSIAKAGSVAFSMVGNESMRKTGNVLLRQNTLECGEEAYGGISIGKGLGPADMEVQIVSNLLSCKQGPSSQIGIRLLDVSRALIENNTFSFGGTAVFTEKCGWMLIRKNVGTGLQVRFLSINDGMNVSILDNDLLDSLDGAIDVRGARTGTIEVSRNRFSILTGIESPPAVNVSGVYSAIIQDNRFSSSGSKDRVLLNLKSILQIHLVNNIFNAPDSMNPLQGADLDSLVMRGNSLFSPGVPDIRARIVKGQNDLGFQTW